MKIAVEKLKEESVLKLLQADTSYQKDSNNEGNAEDAFNELDLTDKQRAVCQHLLDCRDKQGFEYGTRAYIAGLIDAFYIMVEKPFAFENELKEKTERLNALNIELNLNKRTTL